MLAKIFLSGTENLEIDEILIEEQTITVSIRSTQREESCPDCQKPSQRVHSCYGRTVADLPCVGRQVQLHLAVRRFFCDNKACARKTFAERFSDLVDPFARRTRRLVAVQHQVGLVLGGEAGRRTLDKVAMSTSGDTLLRLIRNAPEEDYPPPRVVGVDDWALCKGQKYGTILVDLERHQAIDLLPDRSADTLAYWLQSHPGVEIVSRDRAPAYIDGINRGAPGAIQVADRWHLLRNLGEALQRVLEKNSACLYAAAAKPEPETAAELPDSSPKEAPDEKPLTQAEQKKQATRERRLARYQEVLELHQQRVPKRQIARDLKMSRNTVKRYLAADGFPEMSPRQKSPSILDPYRPYLQQRWAEGCHNGGQLFREIKQQGYPGSRSYLGQWVAQMRKQHPPLAQHGDQPEKTKRKAQRPWSARYAAWLLLKEPETLSSKQQAALKRMLQASAVVRQVYNFGQAFGRIVRHGLDNALDPWLEAVVKYKVPVLKRFARSLEQDKDAVLAALTLPWSNGQVEGQVNRLKMIKRQMYGRANFDLLRRRVLAYSGP